MTDLDVPQLLRLIQTAVGRTVEHEVRTVGLAGAAGPIPPPHDLDSEAEVLSALLCLHVKTQALAPLAQRHFYSRFNGLAFRAVRRIERRGESPSAVAMVRELGLLGLSGPLEEEVLTLRDGQPFVVLSELRERVDRLVELWRQRRLMKAMQRIDGRLRVGTVNSAGAARELWLALEGMWR